MNTRSGGVENGLGCGPPRCVPGAAGICSAPLAGVVAAGAAPRPAGVPACRAMTDVPANAVARTSSGMRIFMTILLLQNRERLPGPGVSRPETREREANLPSESNPNASHGPAPRRSAVRPSASCQCFVYVLLKLFRLLVTVNVPFCSAEILIQYAGV